MGNKQGKTKNAGQRQQNKGNTKTTKKTPVSEAKQTKPAAQFHFTEGMSVDDFELLKVVGKGSFGKVVQVKFKETGKIYAMKILKKSLLVQRKQLKHTDTERKILQKMDHPFIVSLQFGFQTENKLYMVLDYFTGGELFYHLKNGGKFGETRAKFYAAEIALAIQCLHDHDYIYRDLKPENVLLDEDGHIRLTDFGLSKDGVDDGGVTHTFCGTPEYLAPEIIKGAGYGKIVDWWSLGTLLYEMIGGLPPFYNSNLHVMYEKILRGELTFPKTGFSPEAQSFLRGLLDRNPKTRLGANGPDEIRDHPFFADVDWVALYEKKVEPPFKPQTTGEGKMATNNVDKEFVDERVQDTPVFDKLAQEVHFQDFTYRGDTDGIAEPEEEGNDAMYN